MEQLNRQRAFFARGLTRDPAYRRQMLEDALEQIAAFTHEKPVVRRGRLDLPLRYPPYGKKLDLLKRILR